MTTTAQITLCIKKEKRRKKEKQMRAMIWRGPGKATVNHHLEDFFLPWQESTKKQLIKIKCKAETEKMIKKTKE